MVVGLCFLAERRAHALLPAGAHVAHRVWVVFGGGEHLNRTAGRSCHVAVCSPRVMAICPLGLCENIPIRAEGQGSLQTADAPASMRGSLGQDESEGDNQ